MHDTKYANYIIIQTVQIFWPPLIVTCTIHLEWKRKKKI